MRGLGHDALDGGAGKETADVRLAVVVEGEARERAEAGLPAGDPAGPGGDAPHARGGGFATSRDGLAPVEGRDDRDPGRVRDDLVAAGEGEDGLRRDSGENTPKPWQITPD
ncbi:hypothetical protein [Streptomyces canus]|uniref:hypothetical protein n=1 Tax=Streptomyces canus TaxID=58343 RepID=UPI0033BF6B4A